MIRVNAAIPIKQNLATCLWSVSSRHETTLQFNALHKAPRGPRVLKFASLTFAAASLIAIPVYAQQVQRETIRGRVTDDSSRVISGATLMVTRGPDRLTQKGTTDSSGIYRVRFDEGTGDYLVYVSAPGFRAARRRLQRQGDERELVADFTLTREAVMTLDAIKVAATKPVRAADDVRPMNLETGASERWNDGVNGAVSPTVAGDFNALASTMSNVTMTPGGISIGGSDAQSNLTTLNGMGFSGVSIPRAARTDTRITGATFDPTRGGFAGTNVDVSLGSGDRNFQRRTASLAFNPRGLQFGNRVADALGQASGGFRGSFGADGELVRKVMTYNFSFDIAHNASEPLTLLSADADALLRAGVAPDSAARLIAVATQLGLSAAGPRVPSNQAHDAFTWLSRFDDTRDTLKTRALTSYAGWTRDGGLEFNPLSVPSASGQQRQRTLGTQLTLGNYLGVGRNVLVETRLGLSQVQSRVTPYGILPGANVLVRSPSTDVGIDVTGLTLGGGSAITSDNTRWTGEGSNLTMWNASGRRHRFKAFVWGRADGLRDEGISNGLGTFTFNSIADFEAGRASSFSRTLLQPAKDGKVWNAAAAIAHQFTPTKFFSLLYGARLETDGFFSAPPQNPALEQALGVRTGSAPTRVHVSPRIGFSYAYNRDKDNGSGMTVSRVGTFYRSTTGVIRGGIGEFRDLLRPGILADASASTGLTGGMSNLSCVGSAAPLADWAKFGTDPSSIPSACLDGSGPLVERAPSVSLIDPSYDVPHSWRASLDWSGDVDKVLVRLGGLMSYDLAQPGTIDANFSGVQRFALADENGRPVFVSPAAIDAASGRVSATESKRSSLYGHVGDRVSDLRAYGGQLTLALSPDVFKFRNNYSLYGSAGYTLQWSRRQFRGFDGAAFGDPRIKEWSAGPNDARHIIVISGGFSSPITGTLTMFGRAQSGLPFTPIVQADVNGDGRSGDRAFVPNPATETDSRLASQMQSLLTSGSGIAHDCLIGSLGRIASRNGCRGPWTHSLNIQWQPPLPAKWRGRITPNVYLENVLSRSQVAANPVLLVPRAFDAMAQRFSYDVNPRFADTRSSRTLSRAPLRVVLDFAVNLSIDFNLQRLRRAIEPVHGPHGWERRSADSLAAFYLSHTSSLYKLLIEQSDSLFLSKAQVAALQSADSLYSLRVRAMYMPLGQFLAQGGGNPGKAQLDSVTKTQAKYWEVFWEQPDIAAAIVPPTQRDLLPMFKTMVSFPADARKRAQFNFGYPVTFADKPDRSPIR